MDNARLYSAAKCGKRGRLFVVLARRFYNEHVAAAALNEGNGTYASVAISSRSNQGSARFPVTEVILSRHVHKSVASYIAATIWLERAIVGRHA